MDRWGLLLFVVVFVAIFLALGSFVHTTGEWPDGLGDVWRWLLAR